MRTKSKFLTEEQLDRIKEMRLAGVKQIDIAQKMGITQSAVSDGCRRMGLNHNYWSIQTTETTKAIILLYKSGLTQYEIADILNRIRMIGEVCQSNISVLLKKNGCRMIDKYNKTTPAKVEEMKRLFAEGLTFHQISRKLKCHWNTVKNNLVIYPERDRKQ